MPTEEPTTKAKRLAKLINASDFGSMKDGVALLVQEITGEKVRELCKKKTGTFSWDKANHVVVIPTAHFDGHDYPIDKPVFIQTRRSALTVLLEMLQLKKV